ncbi:hypothetical protein DFH29DRAFT_880852 [Suillus ampliporus]|nr:hypothetical protein DFH29DRAFT_880852 [Suillus ampliporus]
MTYIYNHKPGIITGFEHMGSFSDLRLDLDFMCYVLSGRNIGPCYWPTKVSIDIFWPLSKEPLGPLIKASGRANYEVLVPIYGFTTDDHGALYNNVDVISRVFDHGLISVWTWPELVDKKFTAKLAPWPYGHYNTIVLDNLDEVMDNIVTEDFDDASFSQVRTEDYTTASFQHQSGKIYSLVPSSSALELAMALVPGAPSTRTPATESFVSLDVTVPPQIDHTILEYDPHCKPHYWAVWQYHEGG